MQNWYLLARSRFLDSLRSLEITWGQHASVLMQTQHRRRRIGGKNMLDILLCFRNGVHPPMLIFLPTVMLILENAKYFMSWYFHLYNVSWLTWWRPSPGIGCRRRRLLRWISVCRGEISTCVSPYQTGGYICTRSADTPTIPSLRCNSKKRTVTQCL